jgi:4-coumarate--CoA ligase (photoactive yellow protein activation family)
MGAATALADSLGFARAGMDDALLARTRLSDWVDTAHASLAIDDSALTFRTSGSSGAPKRCSHRLAGLWREVDELARLAPGRRRMLAAVPAHHIYGFLFTVLLPQASGAALPVLDLRGTSPAALAGMAEPGDLVIGHPDFWGQVAALAPALAPDVVGVSSGAPCPDATARALLYSGLRLLQVYGSSETAGVGWRERAGEPYRLFPYWRRALRENTVERMVGGEAESFPLQDRLDWIDDTQFLPNGRIDQAVQVGGTNVFPAYVAEVLEMHPGVAQCAVRLMRPDEGTRLKAFVVPAEGFAPAPLRAELSSWLAERLTPAERPAAFSFGPALPRQPGGKPADWIIDAWE